MVLGVGLHFLPRLRGRPLARPRLAPLALGLLLGLVLRVLGEQVGVSLAASAGQLSTAAAYVLFVVGVRVFAPRRTVPGGRVAWFRDAAQWHALAAFGWLLLDALLLVVATATGGLSLGADRHLLGAGFVTLLILGEGAKLLPGFAGQPLLSERFVWLTLVLGNAAAVLRVGPPLLPQWLGGPPAERAGALRTARRPGHRRLRLEPAPPSRPAVGGANAQLFGYQRMPA